MIKPTTIFLGEKANQLFKELAVENGMASRFFFTKIILREARAEASMLTADKLEERLKLINEAEDELVDLINNPPKAEMIDYDYSTRPKSIYMKVWAAHKRLKERGWGEEEIRDYCLTRYGYDRPIKDEPQKTPKKNPNWKGGRKIKVS